MKYLSEKARNVFQALVARMKDGHLKLDNSNNIFMPVHMERLYKSPVGYVYSIAHYGKQNGDLMKDPDIEFLALRDGNIIPLTFAVARWVAVAAKFCPGESQANRSDGRKSAEERSRGGRV
jgi:hypothetical protein